MGGVLEKVIATFMMAVTQGHTQAGTVGPYAQDASWTTGKWVPGQQVGTKQAAIAQGMLLSTTSAPMPTLMQPTSLAAKSGNLNSNSSGVDPEPAPLFTQVPDVMEQPDWVNDRPWAPWTHLFTDVSAVNAVSKRHGVKVKEQADAAFWRYQRSLQAFSVECDEYNSYAAIAKREFPYNFPIYCNNPKYHDTSVAV